MSITLIVFSPLLHFQTVFLISREHTPRGSSGLPPFGGRMFLTPTHE